MKKLITLSIITLLFISCTSDDDTIDPINDEKSLLKMVQYAYSEDVLEEKIVFTYENNKPKKISFYNPKDELMGYTDWLYNDKELLAKTKNYLPNGTLQSESILTYDNNNRMIQKDKSQNEGKDVSVTKFTHNSDKTITANTISVTENYTKTYHINSSGLIYKETIGGEMVTEVIYDGKNPTSVMTNYSTTTYTYDESNLRKGVFLNQYKNIFGENKINPILWGYYLQDQVGSSSNKYIIKQEFSNDHISENIYNFDSEGFPTKVKNLYNNKVRYKIEYVYE